MELDYALIRVLHVIGACLLLGTGAGIAFFMVLANRTQDPKIIAHVAGGVVLGDALFTATAVVAQPVTGYLLARHIGWPLTEPWLVASLALYVLAGIFWLPVVWIQARLRRLAAQAAGKGTALPERYHRLFRIWFWFGFPAFAAVLGIIWLMVTKPSFS